MQIRKTLFEQKIRNAVERDPRLGTEGGKVWDEVATAYKTWAHSERTYQMLDGSPALGSTFSASPASWWKGRISGRMPMFRSM